MKPSPIAFFLVLLLPAGALAQEFKRTPLPEAHPLVGTWRIEIPEQKCFEEYVVRPDGTKSSMSRDERNESEFQLALAPSPSGFYKWTDRITQNNGKLDCSGSNTKLGHIAVNFIRVHPTGQRFLLCEEENMKSCYAEFFRKTN